MCACMCECVFVYALMLTCVCVCVCWGGGDSLMDHNACPCKGCDQKFQSFCGGDMEEDWGEDEAGDAEFVSGETLQFISENRSVWIRMASVIQHFETVDNMSITTRLLSPAPPTRGEGGGGEGLEVAVGGLSADKEGGVSSIERRGSVGEGRSGFGSWGEQRMSWGSCGRESVLTPYGSPPVNVAEGKGRQRHAFMRKMRDVLTCVDLPQLEEAGWKIWEAFDMMVTSSRFPSACLRVCAFVR
jgi:hypothetical protein